MKLQDRIQHVFVLMLENRSYDHILGFSVAGDLTGDEANVWNGKTLRFTPGADFVMPRDPGHSFTDVVEQLGGPGAAYAPGRYPPITMSGFASNFGRYEPGSVPSFFKGFTPQQLPVLDFLARNYCVCRRWFSSMPGPTWPNRFFLHAATSGGMDEMPSRGLLTLESVVIGYRFENRTIFDRLTRAGKKWTVWEGDETPPSILLAGMIGENLESEFGGERLFRDYSEFAAAVKAPDFDVAYNFIEPHYGNFFGTDPRGGNSMHPVEDVRSCELLIKQVYDSVRQSPHWDRSLLIVLFDEHGGFYDHQPPPAAPPPGDHPVNPVLNQHGFDFRQLGVRVPCVIVSPWVAASTDEVVRDHTSVLSTVEEIFELEPLTARDRWSPSLSSLFLESARDDAPIQAPAPQPAPKPPPDLIQRILDAIRGVLPGVRGGPSVPVISPLAEAFVHVAARRHLQVERMNSAAAGQIVDRVQAIETQGDAARYLAMVRRRYRRHRSLTR